MSQMLNAVSAAKIKPVIDVVEPLDNVQKAETRLEQGKQFGKIILSIYV
jgi:NADPH:quinone reductase-like Zn-dependent oxidoreductase